MSKEKKKKAAIAAASIRIARRREEVAYLYLQEGWSIEEIAEWSTYSSITINNDVRFIEAHIEEFSKNEWISSKKAKGEDLQAI